MPASPVEPRVAGHAWFDGVVAREPVDCVDLADPGADLGEGFWAVVGEFDGPVRAWRFADVDRTEVDPTGGADDGDDGWTGPAEERWASSLDEGAYVRGVGRVRAAIREGDVYQVNLCRVLEAPLPATARGEPSARALARRLRRGNPAPFAGGVHIPSGGELPPAWVVSASPELFLDVQDGWISSGPIKGTAPTAAGLTTKDRAENVMIADMVRNDLQRVCEPGSVEVTRLLDVEEHPGLVHLVTTVRGRLLPGVGWPGLLVATYPPASVSGAPKSSALRLIRAEEPVSRGPYCGVVGWVDPSAGTARLAVGIRTFWWSPERGGLLRFGTGAGITWGSDPAQEWSETELKAHRLVGLASGGPAAAGRRTD